MNLYAFFTKTRLKASSSGRLSIVAFTDLLKCISSFATYTIGNGVIFKLTHVFSLLFRCEKENLKVCASVSHSCLNCENVVDTVQVFLVQKRSS